MRALLKSWLAHPLTRGLDLDDPRTTALRQRIIREKPFLRRIYAEWYEALIQALPPGPGAVLELGSGGGFLRERLPEVITSDVLPCPGVERILDAHDLPLADGALRGILMTNVLHHLPRPRRFFTAAARCVRPGGVVAMLEPWLTAWSRLIYGRLHHEPLDAATPSWEFPAAGPLSGANAALPWILFARDRARFEREFPCWSIRTLRPLMPLRYLLSGGVSLRSLVPAWTFAGWRALERLLEPWMRHLAMFALIVLARTGVPPAGEPR